MKVGILGGGQLARMLALAGHPLGLSFRFLEPSPSPPVRSLGEVVAAGYDDLNALGGFMRGLGAVTYEFENVPDATVRALEAHLPVHPPATALQVAQDRVSEKQVFESLGIPTAPYVPVSSVDDLPTAAARVGLPAVLKTRRLGYDGKGQVVVNSPAELAGAWDAVGGHPCILERLVRFSRELSVLGVRGREGEVAFYPLVENVHREGILHTSIAPAPLVGRELQASAESYMRSLLESLHYVGVLALELFQVGDELLANEMAPRVHNSGHWTIDGAECSQFENHLRAVCGFPLGSTAVRGYAGMLNLVGHLPPAEQILAIPGAHLHLYDKAPRPRRKLGHVNVVGTDPAAVRVVLEQAEAASGAFPL